MLARGPTECDIYNSLAENIIQYPRREQAWSPAGLSSTSLYHKHWVAEDASAARTDGVELCWRNLRPDNGGVYLLCISQRQGRVASAIQGKTWSSTTQVG